jgi:hypothetical protein
VALWIEAIEPGKPLSFLDAHIQCGDSLVGVFDPEVLKNGIPDGAYKPLTGDDKKVCSSLSKDNRKQREAYLKGRNTQASLDLFSVQPQRTSKESLAAIEALPEDTLAETTRKQQQYDSWQQELQTDPDQLAADLYTAAFFLPKTEATIYSVPLSEHLLAKDPAAAVPQAIQQAVRQAANNFGFFHWHLRFNQVMQAGGFDCVLGNPPWEMLQLDPREFFSSRIPEISGAANMAARNRLISDLEARRPEVFHEFQVERLGVDGSQSFVHGSDRFPFTSYGRINLAPLFTELALNLISQGSRAGIIVPTGIVTDSFTQRFCRHILENRRVVSVYDFRTGPGLFSEIGHQRFKFCLLTLGEAEKTDFVFFALQVNELSDHRRHFKLESEDFSLLNPNTRTCPVFRSQMDAKLTKKIYSRIPVLINEEQGDRGNPWGIRFNLMFMMNTDSQLFFNEPDNNRLPLYEAKLIHHYDHRWATYGADGSCQDALIADKQDPEFQIRPRYWVERKEVEARLTAQNWDRQWLTGWREVCRSTDERTMISALIPAWGVGHKFMLYMPSKKLLSKVSCFLANLDSLVFDFISRQKVAGTAFSYFYIKQLPVLPPSAYDSTAITFINPRVLELTYTSYDLRPWAQDLGYDGSPFIFDPERRALLRAELDAYYAHLYGLTRDELRYILEPADLMGPDYPSETFRVLKNNEIRQFGEYRTQRLVLMAWDRLFGG